MAPALLQIQNEFEGVSSMVMNFAVSIYVCSLVKIFLLDLESLFANTCESKIIGFGIGPLVLAPLSEIYGRNKIYHWGNVLFTVFTACCGLSPNATSLLIFRLLSGIMGGAPLTNGGGTIADLVPVNERGL